MAYKTYKHHEDIAGIAVENIAKKSCKEAAILERKLTLEHADEMKKLL